MVNIDVCRQVYDIIKDEPHRLDMVVWVGDECGTTACLAGHAALITGGAVWRKPTRLTSGHWDPLNGSWALTGREALGLSQDLANALFNWTGNEEATEVMRILVETGSEDAAWKYLEVPGRIRGAEW